MAEIIRMPKMSDTMEEGVIAGAGGGEIDGEEETSSLASSSGLSEDPSATPVQEPRAKTRRGGDLGGTRPEDQRAIFLGQRRPL